MTVVLLPCPFQFGRWGQGLVEAMLQCVGAETGCQETGSWLFWCGRLAVLRIVCSHFESDWQASTSDKQVFLNQPTIFANSLTRQVWKVTSPSWQEGTSSLEPSQMGGQEGKCGLIARKELSCERAHLYSRLMDWSKTCLMLITWHLPCFLGTEKKWSSGS